MGYVQLDRYTVKADSITNIGTTYVMMEKLYLKMNLIIQAH